MVLKILKSFLSVERGVAQSGSAHAWGAWCRRFKSSHPDFYNECGGTIYEKKKLKRIDELWHKQKTEGLTDEEKKEQQKLRKEYLKSIKGNLKAQLENIKNIRESKN